MQEEEEEDEKRRGRGEEALQEEKEEVEEAGMRRRPLAGGIALAVSAFTLTAAQAASATTYNNDTPIVIPDSGNANPYPSSITVSGTAGPITDVNVGLDGFAHTKPDDVGIVLVAPNGQALSLVDCVGDATDAVGVFLTFDDAAAGKLPNVGALSTGTFQPTNHCNASGNFPAPGPLDAYALPGPGQGATATFASVFNGSSAIGTWSLFVRDFVGGDSGSIPGGWSLDVHPDVTPLPATNPTPTPGSSTKKCKKKKKKTKKGAAAAKKRCKKKKKRRK